MPSSRTSRFSLSGIALIKSIDIQGIALLLVEQNMVQSLEVAQRAYVLDNGAIVLQGSAVDVRNDPNFKRADLGTHLGP